MSAAPKLPCELRCSMLAALVATSACGDNLEPTIEDIVAQLRSLPHVREVANETTTARDVHYLVVRFAQPVNHADPVSPTFLQRVSLLHRNAAAPLVIHTTGYWDYTRDRAVELTQLLAANQISIEHRYFGESRPEPADWNYLTIEQAAEDQHVIISELRSAYPGSALSTGGSKGGMTAVFHRRFFPEDVDGTVPYVAPISFGAPDRRYAGFLDTVGTPTCRQAIRDAAVEMVLHRRDALETRTARWAMQTGSTFTRVAVGPAVEAAVEGLEWAFWQYVGILGCTEVPAVDATDDRMFAFLNAVSPPSDSSDAQLRLFEAYYVQADSQLGYPSSESVYLMPYLKYTDADYLGALPTEQPIYDGGAAMRDVDEFVQQHGERLLFVYGEWDPWTAGAFALGGATDSLSLTVSEGTHSVGMTELAPPDMDAAFGKLAKWTGVVPKRPLASAFAASQRVERIPPAWTRALRARRGP